MKDKSPEIKGTSPEELGNISVPTYWRTPRQYLGNDPDLLLAKDQKPSHPYLTGIGRAIGIDMDVSRPQT
jgi:hypothetical protein